MDATSEVTGATDHRASSACRDFSFFEFDALAEISATASVALPTRNAPAQNDDFRTLFYAHLPGGRFRSVFKNRPIRPSEFATGAAQSCSLNALVFPGHLGVGAAEGRI